MPTHQHLRLNNGQNIQDRRKPAVQLDKEPAIVVRKPGPGFHLALQDDQLMPEYHILGFKPDLRLERREQNGQNKAEQQDHRAKLGDSLTPAIRIKFSVHTAVALPVRATSTASSDESRLDANAPASRDG